MFNFIECSIVFSRQHVFIGLSAGNLSRQKNFPTPVELLLSCDITRASQATRCLF